MSVSESPINFQDRDFVLFRGLFESRIMTAAHIAALFFNGSREAAKKRLQKLKAAGLISERKRKAYEPAVLFLTAKAFSILRENGILAEYPAIGLSSIEKRARVSQLTLQHELEVMDVKVAFNSGIKSRAHFTIAEFNTWPALNQFDIFRHDHGADVLVKPDGFIRIHENENDGGLSEHTFFLELDRSSETQDTLVSRAGSYFEYYKSGGFALKNGAERSAYKQYPFRVLFVFKNAERRNNMAERVLRTYPHLLTHICLATFDEVKKNPFDPIWIRPAEYREATRGTPFDTEGRHQQAGYKRLTAREIFIDSKIKKIALLDP